MEILNSAKTVIVVTPISGYNNHLVRTGNIQENKSLIHAVLTAYSKDYFFIIYLILKFSLFSIFHQF